MWATRPTPQASEKGWATRPINFSHDLPNLRRKVLLTNAASCANSPCDTKRTDLVEDGGLRRHELCTSVPLHRGSPTRSLGRKSNKHISRPFTATRTFQLKRVPHRRFCAS